MKRIFIVFFSLICFLSVAKAAPQLGITPCVIASQPADLTFSASSANVHLSTCGEVLIVFNNSANDARYRLGATSAAAVALTTDILLPSKTFVVLNIGNTGLWFAAIGAGGGTISFTIGQANS